MRMTPAPWATSSTAWTRRKCRASLTARTAAFNFDVAGFFASWTRDVEDAQSPEGAYPMIVPNPVVRKDRGSTWPTAAVDGGPAWADAGVICPWTIYLCYGDVGLLAERYDSMRRYAEFLNDTSRDGLEESAALHQEPPWTTILLRPADGLRLSPGFSGPV